MRLKRSLCLLLVFGLLAGLVLPAAAEELQLKVGVAQSVTVADDDAAVFRFVPEKSGYYCFYSYNSGAYDPYGYILDEDYQELFSNDDSEEDNWNFRISCYMTAGTTYYLGATTYSGSAKYQVKMEQLVSPTGLRFEEATVSRPIGESYAPRLVFEPAGCATEEPRMVSSNPDVVYVDEYNFLYFISPGTATITATLASGLTASCTATTQEPEQLLLNQPRQLSAMDGEMFLRFVAEADGWYGFCSQGDQIDVSISLYDRNFVQVGFDDDSLGSNNFFAPLYLTKGQTCYLHIEHYNETGSCTVTAQTLTAAQSITLTETAITAYPGESCHLMPQYSPLVSIPEKLTWSSSNKAVALVDEYGYVDFLATGTATVSFRSESGKTGSVTVTVRSAPTGALAYGICGPNLQWSLGSNGTLTVTGSGPMFDDGDNWQAYAETITAVSLPQGITSIGSYAFEGCTALKQINLPNSITTIGRSAFQDCTALTTVALPSGLEQLGAYGFASCSNLTTVTVGSLKRIPMGAFYNCPALLQINFPEGLLSIDDRAFYGSGLEEIALPDSITAIGRSAFEGCYLRQLTLPRDLEELHAYAFAFCPIGEVTLPGKLAYFGSGVFYGSPAEQLRFTGSAPTFESYAFVDMDCLVYYPGSDRSWASVVDQSYNGYYICWIPEITGYTITGSITSGTAEDATLELSRNGAAIATATVSGKTGSYAFADIAEGTYTLTVSKGNHVKRTYTVTLASADVTQDVKICLIGDVNGDGRVNIGDAAKLYSHVRGTDVLTDEYMMACGNVNGGSLNIGDAANLYAHVRGTKKLY